MTTTNSLSVTGKLKVRDIYLYLLHNFGDKGLIGVSSFVSTSFNPQKAINHVLSKNLKKSNDIAVLFFYYLPEPIQRFGLSIEEVRLQLEFLKKHHLPIFKNDFYFQAEFSVKGGLFPHNLLGFNIRIDNTDYFVINPYIIDLPKNNTDISNAVKEGLPIDQRNIKSTVKEKTNYDKIIWLINDEVFNEEIIKNV